jgi:hypothetical protein
MGAGTINNNAFAFGAFVPTTNVWDVGQLYQVDVNSPEFKELLVRLYQNVNNIANVLNLKDTGYYTTQEFVNGQSYFPNPLFNSSTAPTATYRQVFRTTVNFGALPNTGTKSVAHNINVTNGFTFTRIYATASDVSGNTYIPIPYVDVLTGNDIQLYVDATNVNIITTSDRTNYTACYVVVEYIKQ